MLLIPTKHYFLLKLFILAWENIKCLVHIVMNYFYLYFHVCTLFLNEKLFLKKLFLISFKSTRFIQFCLFILNINKYIKKFNTSFLYAHTLKKKIIYSQLFLYFVIDRLKVFLSQNEQNWLLGKASKQKHVLNIKYRVFHKKIHHYTSFDFKFFSFNPLED